MANTDDYERLLREVEQFTSGAKAAQPASVEPARTSPSQVPAQSSGKDTAAVPAGGKGTRLAWAGAASIGGLIVGAIVGLFLAMFPFIGPFETAVGAALGAALAAFISGPPEWFDRD